MNQVSRKPMFAVSLCTSSFKKIHTLSYYMQWARVSDLRSEAAFNLSLIYRASGNNKLALHTLRKYCRI